MLVTLGNNSIMSVRNPPRQGNIHFLYSAHHASRIGNLTRLIPTPAICVTVNIYEVYIYMLYATLIIVFFSSKDNTLNVCVNQRALRSDFSSHKTLL